MTTHALTRQRRQEARSTAAGEPLQTLASVDAERAYVTGLLELLVDCRLAAKHVERIHRRMFSDPDCLQLYDALAVLAKNTKAGLHDLAIEVRRQCRRRGTEDNFQRLLGTFDPRSSGYSLRLDCYSDEIADLYHRRQAAELAANVAERLRRGDASADVLADVTRQLEAAADARASSKIISFKQCCDEWASQERSPVVPTGLSPFDDATQGGLPMGAITGLVAPPGGCKSAMALQLVLGALHADKELKAVYGLGEMSPAEIAERYACTGAYVYDLPPVTSDQSKERDPSARNTLATLYADMGERLTLVPPPLTVPSLMAEVVRTGAKLLVVDYLQLVRGEGSNKVEELDSIVDELQRLAVAHSVAVVVISSMAMGKGAGQQSRAHEWARGSGQIGYALKLLYVAEHDEQPDSDGCYSFRWACKKARSIERKDVDLRWDPDLQTFSPPERPVDDFAAFGPGRPR